MDITKNGSLQPVPQSAIIMTSAARDDYANGRRRYKLYAMHVPVTAAVGTPTPNFVEATHPRLAGNPVVIGEITVEAPNLEVAKILCAGLGEMLSKQSPEIMLAKQNG